MYTHVSKCKNDKIKNIRVVDIQIKIIHFVTSINMYIKFLQFNIIYDKSNTKWKSISSNIKELHKDKTINNYNVLDNQHIYFVKMLNIYYISAY
jgi:dimeric dUTPase (all-alpha-NTP-PPase superfamily)